MQKIEFDLDLVNNILQYLTTQKYADVFRLIQQIESQALPQVNRPPAPAPAPEPEPNRLAE